MATVINNPGESTASNGIGFLLGAMLLILAAFMFLYYMIPALRSATSGLGGGGVNLTVPKDINVDVNNNSGQNPGQTNQ
jgi:hypothetical protein